MEPLRAEKRERPKNEVRSSDRSWYDDPLMVIAVLVGSSVAATAIIWIGVELRTRYEINRANEQIEASMREFQKAVDQSFQVIQKPLTTPIKNSASPKVVTVHVPGKSVDECMLETNGTLNEQFKKCRSGYFRQIQQYD